MPRPPKVFWVSLLVIAAVVALYGGSWVWWWSDVSAAQNCNKLKQWHEADAKLRQAEAISQPFAALDFRYNASKFLRASTYVLAGQQSQAEPLLADVLEAYSGANKPAFPKYVQVLIAYGSVYVSQYRMAQAIPMYETALRDLEANKEVETKDGCTVVHMLAKLNRDQGLIDKASPFFKRSIELRRKVYGSNSPEVASATYDFGFAKYIGKDYEGASQLFSEAGKIGDPKLQYAARNALAACDLQLGKQADATALFQQSLANKPAGLEHPSITYTLGRLVRIFSEQKNFEYATRFLQQATVINKQFKQTDDPDFREATVVYASRTASK